MDKKTEQILKLKKPEFDMILDALDNYKLKDLATDMVDLFEASMNMPRGVELLNPEEQMKLQKANELRKKRKIAKRQKELELCQKIDLLKAKIIILLEHKEV